MSHGLTAHLCLLLDVPPWFGSIAAVINANAANTQAPQVAVQVESDCGGNKRFSEPWVPTGEANVELTEGGFQRITFHHVPSGPTG